MIRWLLGVLMFTQCGVYSFSGVSISKEVKTVQINGFSNSARLFNPNLAFLVKNSLENKFLSQTSLNLVPNDGDLLYEGEITKYAISIASASQQSATQNRLTISIRVKFFNKFEPEQNFTKDFSHWSNFDSNLSLEGTFEEEQVDLILQKIINDIFLTSLANW